VGKVKGINYLDDTTDFKNRLERTEFVVDFENVGNFARKVLLVKISASFL